MLSSRIERLQPLIAKDNPASRKPKPKKRKASTSTRCNVFDFLNSKLGDRDQSASHSSSSSVTGAEAYRGGKSTKRSLNVRLFQATEKVAQVEREIKQLTKSLSRRNGRYTLLTFFLLFSLSSVSFLILPLPVLQKLLKAAVHNFLVTNDPKSILSKDITSQC